MFWIHLFLGLVFLPKSALPWSVLRSIRIPELTTTCLKLDRSWDISGANPPRSRFSTSPLLPLNPHLPLPDRVASPTVSYRLRRPPIATAPPPISARQQLTTRIRDNMKTKTADSSQFFPFSFDTNQPSESVESTFEVGIKSFVELFGPSPHHHQISQNLLRMGIETPTAIQQESLNWLIPQQTAVMPINNQHSAAPPSSTTTTMGLAYSRDVVMQAHTGSGKTLAYLLPILCDANLMDPSVPRIQAVILAPSRELANQIRDVASMLCQGTDIRVLSVIGGANVKNQIEQLREIKPHVLVATPGRLAELALSLQKVKFHHVRSVVVDEVDHMLEEPFAGELESLLTSMDLFKHRASSRQWRSQPPCRDVVEPVTAADNMNRRYENNRLVVLCSATGSSETVTAFANRLLHPSWWTMRPAVMHPLITDLDVGKSGELVPDTSCTVVNAAVDTAPCALPRSITHCVLSTHRMRALDMLRRVLHSNPAVETALIFVNSPHRVHLLCDQLSEMNIIAAPLHGQSSKDDRKEVMNRLADGRVRVLVCTDLASRGLDLPMVTHVINFEFPTDSRHYLHRAGRCGRAGRPGLVVNFANSESKFVMRRFGKQLNLVIHDCEVRSGQIFLKNYRKQDP